MLFSLYLFLPLAGWGQNNVLRGTKAEAYWDSIIDLSIHQKNVAAGKSDSLFRYFLQHDKKEIPHKDYILLLRQAAQTYKKIARYAEALRLYTIVVEDAADDKQLIPVLYSEMGEILATQGRYREALPLLFKSDSLHRLYPSEAYGSIYSILSAIMVNMPALYKKGIDHRVLRYLELAEQNAYQHNDLRQVTVALNNKASYLKQKRRFTEALECLNKAFIIVRQEKYDDLEQVLGITKGEVYLAQGNASEALAVFQLAKENIAGRSIFIENLNHIFIAQALLQLGRYRESEKQLLIALQEADSHHLDLNRLDIYDNLVTVYKKTKQYEQAFIYQEASLLLRDETVGKETSDLLNELTIKYETVQKDKELLAKQLKIDQQQKKYEYQKLMTVSIALVATILMFTLYQNNAKKQKLKEEKLRNLLQAKEIEQFKAIMDAEENERGRLGRELHDGIGGMLSAIRLNLGKLNERADRASRKNQVTKISNMIEDTIMEVRRTSHNLMPEILNRYSFTDALVIFCDDMSSNGPDIDVQVHGNWSILNKRSELMLYRVVQELVQNVVKHAKARQVTVLLTQTGEKTNITVEDDGIGFNSSERIGGIGLQNLQYRIQALQGTLSILSEPGMGTTLSIEFQTNQLTQKSQKDA